MEITQSFIDSFSPNPAAVQNGRKLMQKGSFIKLNITPDGTLIFGECAGSGKTPYHCSVDFIDNTKPVARCSCPSRQFPCKHCIGLMIARAGGSAFEEADIPEDIAAKRAKMIKKTENAASGETAHEARAEDTAKKAAARLTAQRKKIDMQLNGLDVAGQLLKSIAQMGLGTIDVRLRRLLAEQVKALGNYYIAGVQTAFQDLLLSLDGTEEARFSRAVDKLTYLHALIGRGQEYLARKRDNPEPDISTNIEELLGHAWKLEELREYGCTEADARLMQLSFQSYEDEAAGQSVEEGLWLNLSYGRLFKTRNYRPHRAAKYIKAEDTVFDIVTMPELFIYPGNLNPRVRWDECVFSPPEESDFAAARNFAARDYAAVLKEVKHQIKSPLADKNPVALIHFDALGAVTGESGRQTVIRDAACTQIILRNSVYSDIDTVSALTGPLAGLRDGAMLVIFTHDFQLCELTAMPLAVLTGNRIIRLLY